MREKQEAAASQANAKEPCLDPTVAVVLSELDGTSILKETKKKGTEDVPS